jgi:hypothetical protein
VTATSSICVIGDTHGHLQLALCVAARWQRELKIPFEALFLAGDIGSFVDPSQLDGATRKHAKSNPCELEFLEQWSRQPQAPWLAAIFGPSETGGLGLTCPVVMVHGNHEGFAHLETLVSRRIPADPVAIDELRGVDSRGFIRYLPSGWRLRTESGKVVAGIGGMAAGQRQAKYHPLAYLDERAIDTVLCSGPVDVLITHQGPAAVQGRYGAPQLDPLLEQGTARYWFHGHSIPQPDVATIGKTTVVPLADVAFSSKGSRADDPGDNGWSRLTFSDPPTLIRERPEFWRDYRRGKWTAIAGGQLVCPDLVTFMGVRPAV